MSKSPDGSNGKVGSGCCKLSIWLKPGRYMVRVKAKETVCHASGFGLYPKDDGELLKCMCHLSSVPH